MRLTSVLVRQGGASFKGRGGFLGFLFVRCLAKPKKGMRVLLWRVEGSGGGVEVEEVEPSAGDGALVNFLEGGAVKGELGGVEQGSLWEFLGLDFVGLEVEEPDFCGLDEGEVDGALDDDGHVVGGGVVCDVEAEFSELGAGELGGEFEFTAQVAGVLVADLGSDWRCPEFDDSVELDCFWTAGLEAVLGEESLDGGAGVFDAGCLVWGEELEDAVPGLAAGLGRFLLVVFGFCFFGFEFG